MYRSDRDRGSSARTRHPYSRPHDLTVRDRDQHGARRESQHGHHPPHVLAAQPHGSGRAQCQICSNTQPYPSHQFPVFHQHYSSLRVRGLVENTGAEYFCHTCLSQHQPYQNSSDDRVKIVVSDILHQFSSIREFKGDRFHVDYVTIQGGLIPDLLHAFRLDYSHFSRPMDVVMVAGYADLLFGYGREYMMEGYKEFAKCVLDIGKEQHPNVANTVAIASLMHPPKLSWFKDNGPEPYNYRNEKDKIDDLNNKIKELNIDNSVPIFPGFHSYGTRKSTTNIWDENGVMQVQHVKCHRWEHWQELARRDKLTLRPDRLLKMAAAVNNYFLTRTGI